MTQYRTKAMSRKQPKKEGTSAILAGSTSIPDKPNLILQEENCIPVSDEIAALIDAISHDHQACTSASKSAIKHAIEAGQKIRAVRAFAGHGNWEEYFNKNIAPSTGISLRTGQRYAQIADEWDLFVFNLPSGCEERKAKFLDQNLFETFRIERATKRDLLRADINAWLTPKLILLASQKTLGHISLDPCSIDQSTDTNGGIDIEWRGNCWIAPGHHGDLSHWITKAIDELELGNMDAGLLMLPITELAQHSVLHKFPIAFLTEPLTVSAQRIKKCKEQETSVIWKDTVLPTSMAVIYLANSPNIERFEQAFNELGTVFVPFTTSSKSLKSSSLVIDAKQSIASESE